MLDPLSLAIIKTVASTCVKLYVGSLVGGGKIVYDEAELGYTVPKWYMNPGRARSTFYAYGTSVAGDEFESLDDARTKAVEQMAEHIRLSNAELIENNVKYDKENIKQRRLVSLFVRGDGLDDFILQKAKVDRRQLVRVQFPEPDMRGFVRLALPADDYVEYEEELLYQLKRKLLHQKRDDILAEIDAEVKAAGLGDADDGPEMGGDLESGMPSGTPSAADSAFEELGKELAK